METGIATTVAGLWLAVILMISFQIKHFCGDFLFQTAYMQRKGEEAWSFIAPLSAHCLVHSALTLLICLLVKPHLWWLAVVDFGLHFIIDRIKAAPRYLGRYRDITKSSFWIVLGIDQMMHHLAHIGIITVLIFS